MKELNEKQIKILNKFLEDSDKISEENEKWKIEIMKDKDPNYGILDGPSFAKQVALNRKFLNDLKDAADKD